MTLEEFYLLAAGPAKSSILEESSAFMFIVHGVIR